MVLSDGTKVWLNAMSSLRYPATFRGRERNVELTGEAYFEVAKNKEMPFRVKSGIQTVRVLGTHFNVNAYADEADIKTTLLEGSVEVSAAANKQLIAPGQQSVFEMQKGALYKLNIDADKEIAWKNGVFQFDGDDIKTIMRQVSRWYNIDVAYSGEIPAVKFFGGISRGSKLSDVLKILELNEMHFERRGSSILVSYAPHQKQN